MTSDEELVAELASKESKPLSRSRNMRDLTNLIETGARYNTSERQMAALANAVRRDDGVDLEANPSLIVTKAHVSSAKKKVLKRLSSTPVPSTRAIFLDGKKFATSMKEKVGDLFHRTTSKEEDHYVVTQRRGATVETVRDFQVDQCRRRSLLM